MSSATLCFSGFSRDDLAKAQQLFAQANADAGGSFALAPETDAHVLVIDMDSMYGHMTWLKARDTGKTTVGLTTSERCETDFTIRSPMTQDSLRGLLLQLGQGIPATPAVAAPAAPAAIGTVLQQAQAARHTGQQPAMPARNTGQQQAMPRNTGQQPAIAGSDEPVRANHAADYLAAVTTGQMAAMPKLVPHEPRISDYLSPNALGGPVKIELPGAPVLLLDPASQTYSGSATLKPLLPYVQAVLRESQLGAIHPAEFERIRTASGGAQPYARLLWFCGLSVGNGNLLPGYGPGKKYLLTKWPQIEREFPKHFRLATVMMKGPALVREIAEQAGVPEGEAIDFVNAGRRRGRRHHLRHRRCQERGRPAGQAPPGLSA
ncbi:MAG: hypothetical protein ABI588_02560 [Arenimonas sp.]